MKNHLGWRDFIGIASILGYFLISILAITSVEGGFQSQDSVLMIEMAQGERTISGSMGAPFVLFLRFLLSGFGLESLIYLHWLAGAITGLLLVTIFGRRHILSWSGIWLLSLPSYTLFNQMIWKDVLFMYLICIVIVLVIIADRHKGSLSKYYLPIAILLTAICLTRLNGTAVACMIIAAFCVNRINILPKLAALGGALVLTSSINLVIANNYQLDKSPLTTKNIAIRMIEDDYLYYAFCISEERLITPPGKGSEVYEGLPQYCGNSYTIDMIKRVLPDIAPDELYSKGLRLFSHHPHLWLFVKFKQADQYLNMKGAFIFPAFVKRLDFLNRAEFKDTDIYHSAITEWMNRNFWAITQYTFQPLWIAVFALYVAIRSAYFKFVLSEQNATQSNVLVPIATFSALLYMSLAFPSMTNDARYFLPATFLCSFLLLNTVFNDVRSIGIRILSRQTYMKW